MTGPDSAGEPKSTCLITMVHGTWGRGFFPRDYRPHYRPWWRLLIGSYAPRWFDEQSQFRQGLELQLEKQDISATFRTFRWSGTNSVFARADAADELAKLLVSDPEQATSIVIAHSHGGNVAFRAISKLGTRGSKVCLITLATPFMQAFPTWSGAGFWSAWIFFFTAILIGLFLMFWSYLERSDASGRVLAYVLIFAVSVAVSALLVRLVINPSPKVRPDRRLNPWPWRPFDIAERVNYDTTSALAPKVLVIRGVDDEAALALAFGAIATALNRSILTAMWNWLYPVIGLFVSLGLLASFLGSYLLEPDSWLRLDPSLPTRVGSVFWIVLVLGTGVFLILPGLFNARFGREFLIGAMRCEIAADSVPDSRRVHIVTLKPAYRELVPQGTVNDAPSSMRHTIYDHPDCSREVAKWIAEHIRHSSPE